MEASAAFGFIVIFVLVLACSALLRYAMRRKSRHDSEAGSGEGLEWSWEDVSLLLGGLGRQTGVALTGEKLAQAQGNEEAARLFALIPEGNAIQKQRLCEAVGCEDVDTGPQLSCEAEIETIDEVISCMHEQHCEMIERCARLKKRFRKARKLKVYQRMNEF